jgi:hypothetical protein
MPLGQHGAISILSCFHSIFNYVEKNDRKYIIFFDTISDDVTINYRFNIVISIFGEKVDYVGKRQFDNFPELNFGNFLSEQHLSVDQNNGIFVDVISYHQIELVIDRKIRV